MEQEPTYLPLDDLLKPALCDSSQGAANSVYDAHRLNLFDWDHLPLDSQVSCKHLLSQFLQQKSYHRTFVKSLLTMAKTAQTPWELRQLAILMLENQILKLAADRVSEFEFLFKQFQLKTKTDQGLRPDLLKEGYQSVKLLPFIKEFRKRLSRLKHIHQKIKGQQTHPSDLKQFIHVSQQTCKLTLARYCFSPQEVLNQILSDVHTSTGKVDRRFRTTIHDYSLEAKRTQENLPDFERTFFELLRDQEKAYWVSEETSSGINALVEYPLHSAALVIKPPGSHFEFEIKRAGVRGPHLITARYQKNNENEKVPFSHRLYGGAVSYDLKREAGRAARFSTMYRLVHDEDAFLAKTLCRTVIQSIPTPRGEIDIYDYFHSIRGYGRKDFARMRKAIKQSVRDYAINQDKIPYEHPHEESYTTEYLELTEPAQSTLCSSSSFRLNLLADYLSAEGALHYFEGQGKSVDSEESRWFVDDLLEEILGIYQPPNHSHAQSYEDYLSLAFALPGNRQRANRVYISLMEQVGKFWGTLLALRGYTCGESFVSRNVGIRNIWQASKWQPKLIFMDHDDLYLPGEEHIFLPENNIRGELLDEAFLFRDTRDHRVLEGTVPCLAAIYHVSPDIESDGHKALYQSSKTAYHQTLKAMPTVPTLRRMFSLPFITRLNDWDHLVKSRLEIGNDHEKIKVWFTTMRKFLEERHYDERSVHSHVHNIDNHMDYINKLAFLHTSQ